MSINRFNSNVNTIYYGVTQGSVLGLLLFLIYINDLHIANKFSSLFNFADYTCLLNIQKPVKAINKKLNKDLKELFFWLDSNKIALNVAKTEFIFFKNKYKNLDKPFI